MKLYRVMIENKLNQRTFYRWLKEQGMIEKQETGYVKGEQALPGMETLLLQEIHPGGEQVIQSQVTIEEEQIPHLLELYQNSGYDKLYQQPKKGDKLDQILATCEAILQQVSAEKIE